MRLRTNFLSMLLVVFLVSTTQATTVSFQNGDANGYTGHASVGFDGNGEPLPGHGPYLNGFGGGGLGYTEGIPKVPNDGFRNHVQLIRFDNIFGGGPNQIPSGVIINSASLTVIQNDTVTYTFDAHRALLPWSPTVSGVSLYNSDPGVRPQGPDLFAGLAEVSSTPTTSAPAIPRIAGVGGEIVFDITADMQYFLDNPTERHFWALARTAQAAGVPYYSYPLLAGQPASAGPLLQVSFSFPPAPEPSSLLLLSVGAVLLVRRRRRS